MKKTFFPAMLLISSIATAATPIDGWYGSVFGGYAYVPNNLNTSRLSFDWTNAHYNSGYDAGGNFGFKSTPLRYEGELTYLSATLNRLNVNHVKIHNAQGFNHVGLAMANVYYDFHPLVPTIEPFLGVGVGYGYVDASFGGDLGSFGLSPYGVTNSVVAYQATGGLTYNFAEAYALNVGYRYVSTGNVGNLGHNFQSHLANVGAVYRFDGNMYK